MLTIIDCETKIDPEPAEEYITAAVFPKLILSLKRHPSTFKVGALSILIQDEKSFVELTVLAMNLVFVTVKGTPLFALK